MSPQFHRIRLLRVAVAVLILLAGLDDAARAQDPFSSFFEGIFGGSRRVERPSATRDLRGESRARRYMPHVASRPQSISRTSSHTTRPARSGVGVKTPGTETYFVAVMGDTLGQLLTTGLESAFETTPEMGFRHKSKENSGLVRDDYFDWLKAAKEIAAEQPKPDVAVMMIGGNDRQPLSENGQTLEPLSPRWRELYTQRLQAVFNVFKEKNIPFILVGLPIMKGEKFAADEAQINDLYREESSKAGVVFVDIWDKFADERGQYSAFGPDVNGEIVKLRTADGVHFTEAGARKLAHFVEADIKRLFDARNPQQNPAPAEAPSAANPAPAAASPQQAHAAAPSDPTVAPGIEPPASAPMLSDKRPAIGPLQQLTNFSTNSEELASRGAISRREGAENSPERALAKHVLVDGGDQPPRHGRGDDFALPVASPKTAPQ